MRCRVHPPPELAGGTGSGVCEEGVWEHYEPSDVILLVICSETRGEIMLRCHCSVKLHTAGQISLTRCILWKSPKSVLFPAGKKGGGWGVLFTLRLSKKPPSWTFWHYTAKCCNLNMIRQNTVRTSCVWPLWWATFPLLCNRATIQKSMKRSS